MREMFDKAWQMQRAPFERVKIPINGVVLDGLLPETGRRGRTAVPRGDRIPGRRQPGRKHHHGRAGSFVARGMAYLVVDLPGQGAALRQKNLPLPPETERLVKALIDYLETRPDVDASRVGMQGISMGGWSAPRAASGEPRIKAIVMGSGALDLGQDLFDYYPPIQERVRWIVGARDLSEARRKLRDYTTAGRQRTSAQRWSSATALTTGSWTRRVRTGSIRPP